MSSVESLFKSFIVLIVCLFSSVVITQFIFVPAELVQKEVQNTGIEDAPIEWKSSDNIDSFLSMGYSLTYFLDFFGIAQFVYTAVRRQRYDVYGQPIEEL